MFKHESECVICLTAYEQEDCVTQLKCSESHYFHADCIAQWVRSGKNSCPICRVQIRSLSQSSRE